MTTELTELLGGPILRRVTPSRVCVWLATDSSRALQLTVMGADEMPLAFSSLEGLGRANIIASAQHVKLGDKLWVYLLQARPQDGRTFPLDTLLQYSLTETEPGGETKLLDHSQLAYGGAKHPSFFIPSRLKHILHGSCRKPHGGSNDGDALARAEALLAEHHGSVQGKDSQRPALLLLTGDQVYADDVAVGLAALLRDKAGQLTGIPEKLPGIDLAQIPLHGRKDALEEQDSGLSSGESENHLFSFGEYAAMYLYVFGNAQRWALPSWQQVSALGAADGAEEAFAEQQAALQRFDGTLGKARKLLANIPTYMIFDDHDVTDDWNITHGWYDDVRESPLGRRIVSNALAAYWAFQGWGNDPDNFDKDMVWSIQQRLTDSTNNPDIAERYDLHIWKHRGWGFSIPTMPPIIAMDSRTQRQYDDKNLPAQLMDRYALDWLRVEWAKLVTDYNVPRDARPVLVAATPVLGFAAIETIQNKALRVMQLILSLIAKKYFIASWFKGPLDRALVNVLDIESWSANKRGYKALFDVLQDRMKLSACLFLSGDVHYAFSSDGRFVCDGKTLDCLQLTSSALSNVPSKRNKKLLEKLGERLPPTAKHGVWLAWGRRKRWTISATLLRPHDLPEPIHAGCNIGLVQFDDDLPVCHTLLTVKGNLNYPTRRASSMTTSEKSSQ